MLASRVGGIGMGSNSFKPAVFLDRDGVLTEEKGYICREEELTIFPYSHQCVRRIKELGYLAIVITNQAAIGKGILSERLLEKMNELLQYKVGVDAVYYCPHHPEAIISKYRLKCNCRKPEIGLLEQAASDFDILIKESYMVGDRASDILAGQKAGLKTILVESGYGRKNLEFQVKADYYVSDLCSACSLISDIKNGNEVHYGKNNYQGTILPAES